MKEMLDADLLVGPCIKVADHVTRVILPRSTNLVRSALADYAVRITELDLSIAEAFERLACLQLDFWHKVTPCNFDVYTRRILTLRYCDAKSWYSIFQALQFSRSKVFRLHRQAVRALKKIPA